MRERRTLQGHGPASLVVLTAKLMLMEFNVTGD